MTLSGEANTRAPLSTIVGAWLCQLAGWVCVMLWLFYGGPGWIAGAAVGFMLWAAFWLDYLQRKVEGRLE